MAFFNTTKTFWGTSAPKPLRNPAPTIYYKVDLFWDYEKETKFYAISCLVEHCSYKRNKFITQLEELLLQYIILPMTLSTVVAIHYNKLLWHYQR